MNFTTILHLWILKSYILPCEAVTVAEVGEQLQMTSSEVAELQFPLTTVTSPEASPLATACSHLTALFFLEGELTSAVDLLGLR